MIRIVSFLISTCITLGLFWMLFEPERIILTKQPTPSHFYKLYKPKRVVASPKKKIVKSKVKERPKKVSKKMSTQKIVPNNFQKKPKSLSKPLQDDRKKLRDDILLDEEIVDQMEYNREATDITELDQEVVITARLIPKYPEIAKKAGKEAMVLVEVVIDERGNVIHATVVYVSLKNYGFEESALEAVKKMLFKPIVQDGHAMKVKINYPINFVLIE
ncbi:energy transducer TonB [bacterium]|jgi:TonB family protein|nr:energy transducer TonB [bacterium]